MTLRLIRPVVFACVLLPVLCHAAVAAQAAGALAGTVTDQNGGLIVGAEVRALSAASGRELSTRTDGAGRYELSNLPAGSYDISVSREGFAASTRRVEVGGAAAPDENFTLLPGLVESAVTVTAGKGSPRGVAETPQAITVVDAAQIEARRPASTLGALERTPNLTPVLAGPALERPRLRGLASNRLLIVLDGERLNNARSDPTSGVSPSVVDVTELESAEALGSAGSGLYGSDAMAGVINLITRTPAPADGAQVLGLRLDSDLHTNGLFRRGAATVNWSGPRVALRASGSLFRGGDYRSGNGAVSLADVVRLGSFAAEMSNSVGGSVARTYAVWSLPARATVPNGQAHGFNDQLDLWFFPRENQSLRYRQLNSQHYNLGFPFIAPPFDQRTQFNSFRRLDKYGLRYEGRELRKWMPRLAAGFYRQKYSFPDDTLTSPIDAGSSWTFAPNPAAPQSPLAVLTGRASTFSAANLTDNKNSVTTWALDAQATFAPFGRALVTTGLGYLRDFSADEFSRADFTAGGSANNVSGRASNPDSLYQNLGWFNLLEYEPSKRLRLSGGLRVDNWKTEARVTRGFPLGSESAVLAASLSKLLQNPGAINTEGVAGVADLVAGAKGITTDRTIVTGSAGVVLRLPRGVNPYLRWGTSFREPGVTERYLLRDFGDPTFSVLVVPNSRLSPEQGRSLDAGVKLQRAGWYLSAGYFRNDLRNFVGNAFAPPLFVPADPARGLNPVSPFFPFHGVLYVQRTNTARARIEGFEAQWELSLPLGRLGAITPWGALGLLKGSNLTPDAQTLALMGRFYNRSDTPLVLRGTASDAPLTGITPLRAVAGARYDSPGRRWFGEYELRYQSRVTRVDPLDLTTAISTQYGTMAGLDPFALHAVRGGYRLYREGYRLSLNAGVENLTDRFYFENFQTAPAPGRSLVLGLTLELFNLLRR